MDRYDKKGSFRAFREEFVDHMTVNGGWPDHGICADVLRRMKRPTKREHISALRSGGVAPAHYARNLIEMMLVNRDERVAHSTRILEEYLRERGFDAPQSAGLTVVLSQVCTPPMPERPDGSDAPPDDVFRNPIAQLAAWPAVKLYKRHVAGVGLESAETAARWVYIRAGQDLTPEGPAHDEDACINAAERIIDLTLSECAERFAALSKREPWTVLFARRRRTALGVSVAVPITASAHQALRSGSLSFLDLTPEHVESPSNYVAFVALTENPEIARKRLNPTRTMLMAVAAQYAALLRCGADDRPSTYRIVAPEGTPKNRDRMLAGQFRALNTHDPRNQSRVWEREFDFQTGEGLAPVEEVILRRIGADAAASP